MSGLEWPANTRTKPRGVRESGKPSSGYLPFAGFCLQKVVRGNDVT